MKEYAVIYEQGPTSWSAYVPDLPICVGAAKTWEEIQTLMKEAVAFHIEGLIEHGDPVPEPTSAPLATGPTERVGYVTVPSAALEAWERAYEDAMIEAGLYERRRPHGARPGRERFMLPPIEGKQLSEQIIEDRGPKESLDQP